jgi:pre-mRNA-splicing factor ATP-dependent RNA helicase DHX15/PRP43
MPADNPYLAHLPPSQRGAGVFASDPKIKEPLYGFLPRKVTGPQVLTAMVIYIYIF